MDNRRLLMPMVLALALFFLFQFMFPRDTKKPEQAKNQAVVPFYQPTGNPREFYTLGSLNPKSPNSMLVTLDSQGASVRRIEMVQRDKDGRFIIRELENKSGYLGYLELRTDLREGSVIRCLPPGSPLLGATANVDGQQVSPQVGDRLISINGVEITSDSTLQRVLNDTKPGDSVEIELARLESGAETEATDAELADLDSPPARSTTETTGENQSAEATPPAEQPGETTPEAEATDTEVAANSDTSDDASNADESDSADEPTQPTVNTSEPLSSAWRKYTVNVPLMARPKKMLGPEYRNTENWSGIYPSTLELSLQSANEVNWKDLDQAMLRDNWKGSSGQDANGPYVRFTFDLPAKALSRLVDRSIKLGEKVDATSEEDLKTETDAALSKLGDEAALRVTKTFRLPNIPAADIHDPNAPAYHVDMEVQIENLTDQPWDLGYRLNGPVSTSIEGWWYQVKTHGGTWKFFYGAGARDVLVSTEEHPYTFYGRPQITQSKEPFRIISADADVSDRTVNYVAVDTHYFNSALMPLPNETADVEQTNDFVCYSGFASAAGTQPGKDRRTQTTADVTYRLYKKLSLAPNSTAYRQTFRMFAGPKSPELLDRYELGNAVNYGWFGLFSRPLLWLLHFFHYFVGNYGLAIVMLTIIVKIAVMPISRKALSNAQMMQLLQPEIKKINEQYKEDMTQRQLATQQLFKRVKYNPLNGCILMPLQIPIFLGLYRGLSLDFALRDQPLIPGLEWCSNLAGPDQFLNWSGFLPDFIAGETGFLGPYLNILPLVAVVLFIVQQRMFTPPAMDEQQQMMQRMMSFMMIFMAFMFFKVPAGLCIYIITSSLWSLVERTMIPKPQLPQNVVDKINSELGTASGGVVEGTVVDRTSGATRMDDDARRELKERDRDRRRRLRERDK